VAAGTVTGETELVKFAGGIDVRGWNFTGFRGRGTVSVDREGLEFRLNPPFGAIAHRRVKRADLADVYAVQARRLSVTSLIAAVVPRLSNTAVRFLTPATGVFADRDVYTFFPRNGEQPQLIDLLDQLGYPVDRTVKTYRLYWGLEMQDGGQTPS
jgi:hypothetical protein